MEVIVPDLQKVRGRYPHPCPSSGCSNEKGIPLHVSGEGVRVMDQHPVPDALQGREPAVAIAEAAGTREVHCRLDREGMVQEVRGQVGGGPALLPDPFRQLPDGRDLHLGPE
jgi:hypothetical protein